MIYQTKDGDVLDAICMTHYGRTAGVVEQVLVLNRHLVKYGAVFPAGVRINLPPIEDPKSNQKIKMWQ